MNTRATIEKSLDDYKDVNERIREFYGKYPNGRLTKHADDEIVTLPLVIDRQDGTPTEVTRIFVKYTAAAYRTPDDPHPGIGTAWEPFPGRTPYTRDSELMNAETAAWGRAIVACGIIAKNESIASRQEIQNRQIDRVAPVLQSRMPLTLAQQIAMISREAGFERAHLIKAITGKEHGKDLTREEAELVVKVARTIRDGMARLEQIDGEWNVVTADFSHPSQQALPVDGEAP